MRADSERPLCSVCSQSVATSILTPRVGDETCPRCMLQPRSPGAQLCAECHGEIVEALGAATVDLARAMADIEITVSASGIHELYLSKRRRLPTHRANVTGLSPLKGAVRG